MLKIIVANLMETESDLVKMIETKNSLVMELLQTVKQMEKINKQIHL